MNSKPSLLALTLLAVSLAAGSLSAQTLQQRQQRTTDQTRFASDEIAPTTQRCGRELPATINWDSFDAEGQRRATTFCAEAYSALRSVCDSDLGRQAVTEKITSVVCRGGSERGLALNAGVLEFTIDFEAPNYHDYLLEWLGNNL